MPISRRHFLRAGAIVVVAAGTPMSLSTLAAERHANNSDGTQQLNDANVARMSKATFAPHLNTVFIIRPQHAPEIPVKLIELQDFASTRQQKLAARPGRECFSLAFRAPAHQVLKQNTYRIEHPTLGQFDLFIGPVQSKTQGQIYEAIINHRHA